MKQFFTILKFELDNYFKSKSYVISTILIAVLAAGIMFVPRVKDAITGDKKDSTVQDSASKEDSSAEADAEHTSIHMGSTIRMEYWISMQMVQYGILWLKG